MSDFNKNEFEKNIGKDGMQCFDNDLKFMGAHEICKTVLDDKLKCEMNEMDRYIDGLFLQLKPDITVEVKGNAVTCISKICTKLNSTQIEKVVKELIKQITSTNKEIEDIRDVFVMCIKNIIQEVPHDFSDKLEIVLVEADKGIKSARTAKQNKAEQELVEIITLMFRRWGNIYKDDKFNHLIKLLKSNVTSSNIDENLRKKSCISIGAVSVMLNKKEVSELVKELISEHQKVKDPKNNKQEQEKLKAISSTLNALSKTVAQKMESEIPSLIQLLNNEFNRWGLQEDTEEFDFTPVVCEQYESFLSTLENLLKGCSIACFTLQQKKDLIEMSVEMMTMDPNNNCSGIEDQDEEMGSDEDEDSDDDYIDSDTDNDDQSWRVRRSAMLLLEQIVLSDKHLLDSVYHNIISPSVTDPKKNIIRRLRERNEGVRSTIIQVLSSFINQIMVSDHNQQQQDLEEDFGLSEGLTLTRVTSKLSQFDMHDVIGPITKEIQGIYADKKYSAQIKIQAFRLIENLSFTAGKQILDNEITWKTIFALLQNILQDKKAENEIKTSCLVSLKRILKFRGQHDLRHIQNDLITIFDIVQGLITTSQFKIKAECLRLISGIFRIIKKCLHSQINQYTPKINNLLPEIIRTLEQADVDQEIKYAVISVASGILVYIGSTIGSNDLSHIFKNLQHKVTNENKNRINILKLYKRVPLEILSKLNDQCIADLNLTTKTLCQFLNKEDRSERIATLEALEKLVTLLGVKLENGIQKSIIDGSLHMIKPKDQKDTDPSLANIALSIYKKIMEIQPAPCDQYTRILEGCLSLTSSSIFQSSRYNVLYEVFQQMAQKNIIKVEPTIFTLLNGVTTETINATSKAIAALVLVSSNKNSQIESINKQALQSHGSDMDRALSQRQCCLQTLCEIGKTENLTNNKAIFDGVLNLINNKQEDLDKVRKYASIAFGGISLQNLDISLPKVIEFINQGKNPYLMLNTLKEIIQNSTKINEKQLASIVDFLFKQAGAKIEAKEQDLKNIVSECIGKLCIHNLTFLKPTLLSGLKNSNENVRFCAASSYKFFFTLTGKQSTDYSDLGELAQSLMSIVNDKCIHTREAVMKSLNSMAFNLPKIIEDEFQAGFFLNLKESFSYFDVVETDLGAFKDKRDKGAPLRTAAFQFLQTCLQFKQVSDLEEKIVESCMFEMAKESEADIKLIRSQIILRVAKSSPTKVIPNCMKIKDAMVAIMKVFVGAKPIPESSFELVKTCCEVLNTVDVSMSVKDPAYNNFLEALKKQNDFKFGKIFDLFALQ